jgi:hypothetical protein
MNENEDVERGYYVYLHRDRATQRPFYVGKGKGRRAYDVEGRHPEWHGTVKNLVDGFAIEIVKNDLTEEEAYDLERELIRRCGKVNDGTGTLVNLTDGGSLDFGEASVEFGIALPSEWVDEIRADYEARRYRKLGPEERRSFAEGLVGKMRKLQARYKETTAEDEETDLELDCANLLWQVANLAEKYAKRRVSSKGFGCELEDLYEDTEWYLEDANGEKPEMIALLKECKVFLEKKVAELRETGPASL